MVDVNLSPYTAEQQTMDRRRRMAEAMQQQAVLPIEMPTVPGAKISHLQGFAKLLQGYIAGKELSRADEAQKAYQNASLKDMATLLADAGRQKTIPGEVITPRQESMFIPENVTRYNETKNQPESFTEEERNAAIDLPLKTKAVAPTYGEAKQVPFLSPATLSNPQYMKTDYGKQMLLQVLLQQKAQEQAAAQAELAASRQIHKFSPEDTAGTIVNGVFKPIVTGVKKPNWEKFSKFDDKTGVEITGLIDKNAPKPLDTFVEGARKPEDLVSVDTVSEQGQPVTRYLKKSDPLLTSGVPKPLVGILGDLQMAGALPANWKDNPAIVDLVNTSFINKTGGITPKDVFNFRVAVADLNIKKATLADQGISANVAIPTAPAQSTGVLGAIQNRPVSQAASVITPAPAVVPTAKANRPYTPLNAPLAVTPAPVAEPIAAPTGLSPRDQREIEKQKILSANKDMTETQSNAALFGGSMAQAHATMNQLEKAGTVKNAVIPAMMQSLVGLVPLGVGEKVADQIESIAKTDPTGMFGPDQNQQRLGQAQVAFATSWLRKTSGASFGASEVANTIKEFFPMRGEGDSVIKQKREARDRAIKGMKLGTTKEGQAYIDQYLGVAPNPAGGGSDPLGLRGK